ncbi:uncharacterized protein N7458_002601 [Penicillium daleae]|uniref:Uncharacterized protein n=1 Tax=Penicillium daleae TaxID=63821 RepID=A0AAD6G616_9EURO|nr:uncharacterized protein N7458_002601 [Penicillium daleae]KAJ5461049.1 hypothetical protein N7458_002601 [Penicillium daleae]
MPDPPHPSIPRNHDGLPAQSVSLYSSQTASVYHHGRWHNGQFAGSCGSSVVPYEGTSDRTWSEATDSLDERDLDESPEDTETTADMNMRYAQNDVMWEPRHQGHPTDHIAFAVPDNQELIASLDFASADANLFNARDTMALLTTASDADFLDAEFHLESTPFHLNHVNS